MMTIVKLSSEEKPQEKVRPNLPKCEPFKAPPPPQSPALPPPSSNPSRFQEWSGKFNKQKPFQESSLSTSATSARTQLL